MPGDTPSIHVGDGQAWTFTNGPLEDAPEDVIGVPDAARRLDGPALQGHHYGFLREPEYSDLCARFRFRLGSHSDAGMIFHAAEPSDFLVLHFPECGQANRAQHFWAAVSKMEDGWLRIVKMDLVRRVASTNKLWHQAEASLVGDRLRVRIDERGLFEVTDPVLRGYGRCGVYLFASGQIAELSIQGRTPRHRPWRADKSPPRRWFLPASDTTFGSWQRPGQIVRVADGTLLHNFTVQERPYSGAVTPLVNRSHDNGRTWTTPEPVAGLKVGEWEDWGCIHVFPDGHLRMLVSGENEWRVSESTDGGRTWLPPQRTDIAPTVPGLKRLHPPPAPFVNVNDGSVLLFGYGGHDSTIPNSVIQTWGSHHCQSFVCRSTDNGRSWSQWMNLDGTQDGDGKPVTGNLDLTETCGVETGPGQVLAFTRPIYSPWMWESWSEDGGRTWSPCLRGPFPGYATPNMVRTASGAILVAHRLPGCTVHTSLDEGLTWDQGVMIDSAIWCMGSMVEIEPDLVLYVYWDSFESFMRAQYIRITPHGIVPGE